MEISCLTWIRDIEIVYSCGRRKSREWRWDQLEVRRARRSLQEHVYVMIPIRCLWSQLFCWFWGILDSIFKLQLLIYFLKHRCTTTSFITGTDELSINFLFYWLLFYFFPKDIFNFKLNIKNTPKKLYIMEEKKKERKTLEEL